MRHCARSRSCRPRAPPPPPPGSTAAARRALGPPRPSLSGLQRSPGLLRNIAAMAPRVGIVGLGYWGPNLARNLNAIEGCELAWCCDSSQAALDHYRPTYPDAA